MSLNEKYSKNFETMSYKLERLDKKVNDFEPSNDLIKNKEGLDDFDAMFDMYDEELKKIIEEINNEKELDDQSINEKIKQFKNKIEFIKNKYIEKKNKAEEIEKNMKKEEEDYYKENKGVLKNIKDKKNSLKNKKRDKEKIELNLDKNKCFGCGIS